MYRPIVVGMQKWAYLCIPSHEVDSVLYVEEFESSFEVAFCSSVRSKCEIRL